jgi:YesN/AraC family two-component response regulator
LYLKQAALSAEAPVFRCMDPSQLEGIFDQMISKTEEKTVRELRLVGLLNILLSKLIEINGACRPGLNTENISESYITKAIRYMHTNYSRQISISDIARDIGLNISYLGIIFKKYTGCTPQEYLIRLRIAKACSLMANPSLSIRNISHSVGYDDVFHFSKMFKKVKGLCPREYRKING